MFSRSRVIEILRNICLFEQIFYRKQSLGSLEKFHYITQKTVDLAAPSGFISNALT